MREEDEEVHDEEIEREEIPSSETQRRAEIEFEEEEDDDDDDEECEDIDICPVSVQAVEETDTPPTAPPPSSPTFRKVVRKIGTPARGSQTPSKLVSINSIAGCSKSNPRLPRQIVRPDLNLEEIQDIIRPDEEAGQLAFETQVIYDDDLIDPEQEYFNYVLPGLRDLGHDYTIENLIVAKMEQLTKIDTEIYIRLRQACKLKDIQRAKEGILVKIRKQLDELKYLRRRIEHEEEATFMENHSELDEVNRDYKWMDYLHQNAGAEGEEEVHPRVDFLRVPPNIGKYTHKYVRAIQHYFGECFESMASERASEK
ncbi:unnamed protein product [Brachionus calyciflorus]|uniref:Uncharacterized protein n=1 Tax=Brachionus calyciflorus TaxID=104777 RepID=A0A813SCP3_9BILA|nr:unnamed protein product [Brachionus calyciflorus]